jgi:signal transduction histidine kinase
VENAPLSVRLTRSVSRVRNLNPWIIDALITTPLALVALRVLSVSGGAGSDYREPTAWAYALTVVATVPYFFRRFAPLPVFVVATSAMILLVIGDFESNVCVQLALIGTYTVATYCSARQRYAGIGVLGFAFLLLGVFGAPGLDATGLAANIGIFAAAYFFGSTIRNRRLYMEQLEERAASLERERDEEAKRAVADERLRIAQELHDVVAHSMGVIAVQAGVGAHVIDTDPVEAKRSLEAISATSRSTLTEIRRMLGVLREDTGAEYEPAPDLAELPRLVDAVRAAGLEVEVNVAGSGTDVPPGVSFTAYRIVQEALTNVLKHAGPARATVVVDYEPGVLHVEVADDGRGVNGRSSSGGHGLVGMRERVAVYGGTLTAAPRLGGGFRVAATLPYGADT